MCDPLGRLGGVLQRKAVFSFGGAVSFSSPLRKQMFFFFLTSHSHWTCAIGGLAMAVLVSKLSMAAFAAADLCRPLLKKAPSIGISFGERGTLLSLDSMRPRPPVFLRRALAFRSFSSTPPPPSSSQSFPNFATISLSAPAPHVVTVTLNRPEKLNAMNKVTSASVQKCLPW